MVVLLFEEYGWNICFLGVNFFLEYVEKMVIEWKLYMVGLFVSIFYYIERFVEYIKILDKLELRLMVMVGGCLVF